MKKFTNLSTRRIIFTTLILSLMMLMITGCGESRSSLTAEITALETTLEEMDAEMETLKDDLEIQRSEVWFICLHLI